MPRKRNETPSYQKHSSGRARAAWTDHLGFRREKMLPGAYGSPESKAAYARVILELAASPALATLRKDITVAEMLLAFTKHAEGYYLTTEGKPGREVRDLKYALQAVWRLYGDIPAREFGPLALKAVREHMVVTDKLSRKVINARINKIKRAWKWATSEEMIPPGCYEALRTVSGLRQGKTAAKERPPVQPVEWNHVKATLPHLSAQVRAMVLLLWHTGARPSELCQLRLADIDRTSTPWVFKPRSHKTAHHGHSRAILFGPKAIKVLTGFLAGRTLDPDRPVFSPQDAREERYAAMRAKRKSKVQPSQVYRRKQKPKRAPQAQYTPQAIGFAVRKACKKAEITNWHPYQLRHAAGTRFREEHGLEAAQVLLGHNRADVTQVYAERNIKLGIEAARQSG